MFMVCLNLILPKKMFSLEKADGWLIAAAIHLKLSIVTHETNDPNCKRKILLPVIATHFNVSCIKIFNVLRSEKVQFL